MLERFEHDDIIDFLDDSLPEDRAEAMRNALNADPDASEQIELLAQDSQMLRAMPEPELTERQVRKLQALVQDQIDKHDLELDLARPMLMDESVGWSEVDAEATSTERPGAYRRRLQKQRNLRSLRRSLLAASLFLAAGSGAWITIGSMINNPLTPPANTIADGSDLDDDLDNDPWTDPADESSSNGIGRTYAVMPTEGDRHHAPVLNPTFAMNSNARASAQGQGAPALGDGPPVYVAADIALRVGGPQAESMISVLSAVVGEQHQRLARESRQLGIVAPTVALVRNANYDEAIRIASELQTTGVDGGTFINFDHSPWQQDSQSRERMFGEIARRMTDDKRDAELRSGTVAGSRELTPTLTRQLSFSSAGAEYTMLVRADDIPAMLKELDRRLAMDTSIDFLPVDTYDRHGVTWIEMRRLLAERLDEWATQAKESGKTGTVMIQIPIVIDAN